MANLEFIKSASGTQVSTLDVTDCFSDKYEKCNDLFNSKQTDYCQDLSLNLCKFKSPI